jgi:Uncharacterized Fe-S center protein
MNYKRSCCIAAALAACAVVFCLSLSAQAAQGATGAAPAAAAQQPPAGFSMPEAPSSTVYFTKKITSEAMIALYSAMGRNLPGRVGVKLSTGEAGDTYYLSPKLIAELVHKVNGTIVECNTAYPGQRTNTAMHMQVAKDHGFTAIANVDIMDSDGSMSIPVPKGVHLKEDIVGSHLANYDSLLVLSHFKGHAMGGFGGALKNISIGVASPSGKLFIHSAGAFKSGDFFRVMGTDQNAFVESMAEAASAVAGRFGKNIVYISVMNNLSIDCDCSSNPAKPEIDDIGMLASTDPVALDQACVDLIYKADPKQSASIRKRMEDRKGAIILDHGEAIGLGLQNYKLVSLDDKN